MGEYQSVKYPLNPWASWLDNVHGLPGHCPWNQWKVWTKSIDTLDKVQGAHSDWTMFIVHCLPRQCPWTPWTMSMDSVESVDIVH